MDKNHASSIKSKGNVTFGGKVCYRARNREKASPEIIFSSPEFLSAQQISAYFFRLSARGHFQQVSEIDLCAREEEHNFTSAREAFLSTLDLLHPIRDNQFDIYSLVWDRKLSKLKVGML